MALTVKLQVFEGPLDLLLHLIEKAEVDIYDIPIAEITDQYIGYIHLMQELDLDIASEFLVMAATLLEIKSKMLLPKPKKEVTGEEYIDPRAELVAKLLEYKKYKDITSELKDKLGVYEKVFYKLPEPIEDYITDFNSISNVTVDMLYASFQNILIKSSKVKKPNIREIFREIVTVDDKIKHISKLLITRPSFYFTELFENCEDKYEIIVTFLALLELIKRKSIMAEQQKNFGDILIKRRNKLS